MTDTANQPMTSAERKRKQRALDKENPNRKHMKLDTVLMFGEVDIAYILDNDNNIWFKGVDIARALEMENPHASICNTLNKKYCTSVEQLIHTDCIDRDIAKLHPKTTFLNETGLNLFILRSQKPKAVPFSEWICGEVLPCIRKYGEYILADSEDNPYRELNVASSSEIQEPQSRESDELQSDESNSKIQELQSQLNQSHSKIEDIQSELNASHSEIEDMQSQSNVLHSTIEDMQSLLNKSQTQIKDLQLELNESKSDFNESKLELKETKSELKESKLQIKDIQSELKESRSRFQSELDASCSRFQSELDASCSRFQSELDASKTELDASRLRFQSELDASKAELRECRSRFQSELDTSKTELRECRLRFQSELDASKSELITTRSDLSKGMNKIFTMQPTCVPELDNPLKKEYIVILRSNDPDVLFPYYCLRRQEHSIDDAIDDQRNTFPTQLLKLSTPNSVNFYNFILEHIPTIERTTRVANRFRLKPPYTEDQFLRDVKNFYRSTYGIAC